MIRNSGRIEPQPQDFCPYHSQTNESDVYFQNHVNNSITTLHTNGIFEEETQPSAPPPYEEALANSLRLHFSLPNN